MPIYCFKNQKTGEVIEKFFSMADVPDVIKFGRKTYERDMKSELVGVPSEKGWPIECLGSGVNADQAGELRDYFKKNGMNVEVSNDGNPIYTSNAQRKKALRLRGFIDKSSYL